MKSSVSAGREELKAELPVRSPISVRALSALPDRLDLAPSPCFSSFLSIFNPSLRPFFIMPPAQSSAAASSSGSITNALLQGFWRLPSELQQNILFLACRPGSSDSLLALDLTTTRSLALVSRRLYPQIVMILYRSPKITTISALRSFQFALSSRPALGRLVKDLHIGPVDDLPRHWWPLSMDGDEGGHDTGLPEIWLSTSLGENDEDKRPRWCRPRDHWSLLQHFFRPKECHDRAVLRAIHSALTAIDVKPDEPHLNRSQEERIGRVRT